jgi:tetratricopeptide (TPR) repeat protein
MSSGAAAAKKKDDRNSNIPVVARDPRFRAGRTLIQRGQAGQAVETFASLLQEARTTYGEDSIETAPAYYEYGNALFRSQHVEEEELAEDDQKKPPADNAPQEVPPKNAREAAAAAAERRAQMLANGNKKPAAKVEGEKAQDEESIDDVQLALEIMETAWSIVDVYLEPSDDEKKRADRKYVKWAKEQNPRILTGIGDVLSALGRHPDSVDVYLRALEMRQEALAKFDSDNLSLEHLECRRLILEANILIAEELLACPLDRDVVTTESQVVLIKASEGILSYAKGYYETARTELQDAIVLMAEMAAKGINVEEEKEGICWASTLLMAVGTNLGDLQEEEAAKQSTEQKEEPVKKKPKT